jgi:2-phosphosulfolactate phosphatase
MKVNVLFSPVNADELYFANKTTVVIDVLRASSTIINALSNGAKEVIPVATVEFAVKVSGGMFGGQTLLGGERNTKKIEGFALGNSPIEYYREFVEDKFIVFFSTNGSKAVVKAKFSQNLVVCSFNNLSSIANYLIRLKNDVEILCAGNNNNFSLEDSVCAGKLIEEIKKKKKNIEVSDSSAAAYALYERFGDDILEMLKNTEQGKKLIANGFAKDLEFCSDLNINSAIPYFDGIKLKSLELKKSKKRS